MQNTSLSQIHVRARRQQSASVGVAFFMLACLLCAACMVLAPQTAFAKSYSMPEVNIQATVRSDGSLHVSEQRTFDFNGTFSCVWWEFGKLSSPKALHPQSVAINYDTLFEGNPFEGSATGGMLSEVPFQTEWRSAGGPGGMAYSFDEARDTIYVFFDAADTQITITVNYVVENAVDLYEDCAVLYWQYLGSDWAQDSRNVSCTIALPAGTHVGVAGETVRAWGHGPLNGTVSFNKDATEVTLDVPRVKAGEFAEARVVFPNNWLAVGPDYASAHSYTELHDILAEEKREAARANRGRVISLLFFGVLGLVSLVSIVWSLVKLLTQGLEYKPDFRGDYWRDVPNKSVHPAVIGRLCRWDKEDTSDVLVSILHLANEGVIAINKGFEGPGGSLQSPEAGSAKYQEHYYLTLNEEAAGALQNPIDTKLIKFLFGDIAKNKGVLWLEEIDAWGKAHKKSFNSKLTTWQNTVSAEVKKQDYFEKEGEANQGSAWVLAMALAVIGFYISFEFVNNLWPMIIFGATAVVVLLLSIKMPRRTQAGANDYARAQGLKKWLKDFTLLDERPPTDVKVWGGFMVYAQLFGIAEQTMRKLRDAVPELFVESDTRAISDGSYVPWHTWYVSDSVGSTTEGAFSRSFDNMWQNTSSMAAAAAAASSGGGGGGWSSFSGGGGGFSGGGGGGFGGGGGGAR